MHRLAHTLLSVRPADSAELLLRVVARSHARGDRVMEARAFLLLGIARMRTRDDRAGAEAYRASLKIAREVQALDVAANASMNLGVIEMRGGEFAAAHEAFNDALRLYTTLRNNTNRLAALYNLANLERERGDTEAAEALYLETASLAETVGAVDISVGARAGAGLCALRLDDLDDARSALAAARRTLGGRDDWWFQGRELFESLTIRLSATDGEMAAACVRFKVAVDRLAALDAYAAAWMVTDCAAELVAHDSEVWEAVERFAEHAAVKQFVPLAARFTALRDVLERLPVGQQRRPV
jgi:tetratricopeptide (TPR) repeat protein